jgi:hypothetical protein
MGNSIIYIVIQLQLKNKNNSIFHCFSLLSLLFKGSFRTRREIFREMTAIDPY